MKTPEDEAFEDIERRQGGGFPAKRAMAADKLLEPVECLDCGSNNVGIPATYDSLVNSVKSQPAQDGKCKLCVQCLERLIRIMGTFDLATGHADTFDELLNSLESELRDVLGYYRQSRRTHD